MFELSDRAIEMLPRSRSSTAGFDLMRRAWAAMVDAQLDIAREQPPLTPSITCEEFWRAVLQESWAKQELGAAGWRLLQYKFAYAEGWGPSREDLTVTGRSNRAYAWVAEQERLTGADPIDAVRRSTMRFKEKLRSRGPVFLLDRNYHLVLCNGLNALAWMESLPNCK